MFQTYDPISKHIAPSNCSKYANREEYSLFAVYLQVMESRSSVFKLSSASRSMVNKFTKSSIRGAVRL
jgi:hypothetical protein